MSKKIISLFPVIFVLLIIGTSVFSATSIVSPAEYTDEDDFSDGIQSQTEATAEVDNEYLSNDSLLETQAQTEDVTEQPTTYVEPLQFPSVSVSAISNFFGKSNAEYNQYTKEFTVTYFLKSSKGILTTQWNLEYDSDFLKLDPEKNTAETICPVIGDKAVIRFEDNHVYYNATSIDLFDFSAEETPFVQLVFDVAEISVDEPIITKIDLAIDMLWVYDGKKEISIVNNFNVLSASKLSSLNITRGTSLTESNYVEPTTAEQTTSATEDGNITPDEAESTTASENASVAATDATSVTEPLSTTPKNNEDKSEEKHPDVTERDDTSIDTGSPVFAFIMLAVSIIATGCLFVMRKKVMLID